MPVGTAHIDVSSIVWAYGQTARSLGIGFHWPFESWGRFLPEHTTAISLRDRLLHPRASRSAAMFALAGQVPAPVLADPVGISTGKAAAWAKLAARDWSDYVANRAASR